jgi:hypothetical protein
MLAGGSVGAIKPVWSSKFTGWAKASFTGPRVSTSGCSSAGIGGAWPVASPYSTPVAITIAITIIIAVFISSPFQSDKTNVAGYISS